MLNFITLYEIPWPKPPESDYKSADKDENRIVHGEAC